MRALLGHSHLRGHYIGTFHRIVARYHTTETLVHCRQVGLRPAAIASVSLLLLSAGVRSMQIAVSHEQWHFAVAAAALNGMAAPIVCIGPPVISASWFPAGQRAAATATMQSGAILGLAGSWIAAKLIVQSDHPPLFRMWTLYWCYLGLSAAMWLAVVCGLNSRPRTAPSVTAALTRATGAGAGRRLAETQFALLLASYMAADVAARCCQPSITSLLPGGESGALVGCWLPCISTATVILSGLLAGGRRLQRMTAGLAGAAALLLVLAPVAAMVHDQALGLAIHPIVLTVTTVGGISTLRAAACLLLELAARSCYPVAESTTAGMLLLGSRLGTLGLWPLENLAGWGGAARWVAAAAAGLATVLLWLVKPNHGRDQVDTGPVRRASAGWIIDGQVGGLASSLLWVPPGAFTNVHKPARVGGLQGQIAAAGVVQRLEPPGLLGAEQARFRPVVPSARSQLLVDATTSPTPPDTVDTEQPVSARPARSRHGGSDFTQSSQSSSVIISAATSAGGGSSPPLQDDHSIAAAHQPAPSVQRAAVPLGAAGTTTATPPSSPSGVHHRGSSEVSETKTACWTNSLLDQLLDLGPLLTEPPSFDRPVQPAATPKASPTAPAPTAVGRAAGLPITSLMEAAAAAAGSELHDDFVATRLRLAKYVSVVDSHDAGGDASLTPAQRQRMVASVLTPKAGKATAAEADKQNAGAPSPLPTPPRAIPQATPRVTPRVTPRATPLPPPRPYHRSKSGDD